MDDWRVGDLALCIDDREWPGEIFAPWNVTVGGLYRVTGVDDSSDDVPLLDLAEDPFACDDYGWDCRRFRKIAPLTDDERDSFLADLDAPVSPAVPSDGRKVVALHNAGGGHLSPASALLASLPDPSAAHTPCLADGSGLSDHVAAHAATANN